VVDPRTGSPGSGPPALRALDFEATIVLTCPL
jgi:hypothetical protein